MVRKINILSIALLSRKCLGENKIRAKQARAMSGCNLFSFCARVLAVLCLHVKLSFVGVLWTVGEAAFSAVKKHKCYMADVHCGRSEHPSPVSAVPVLCTCATTAGGEGRV